MLWLDLVYHGLQRSLEPSEPVREEGSNKLRQWLQVKHFLSWLGLYILHFSLTTHEISSLLLPLFIFWYIFPSELFPVNINWLTLVANRTSRKPKSRHEVAHSVSKWLIDFKRRLQDLFATRVSKALLRIHRQVSCDRSSLGMLPPVRQGWSHPSTWSTAPRTQPCRRTPWRAPPGPSCHTSLGSVSSWLTDVDWNILLLFYLIRSAWRLLQ